MPPQGAPRHVPRQRLLDAMAADGAHAIATFRIVQQLADSHGERLFVVRRHVHRRIPGGDPGLDQVERDDGAPAPCTRRPCSSSTRRSAGSSGRGQADVCRGQAALTYSSGTRPVNSTTSDSPSSPARATMSSKASPPPMKIECTVVAPELVAQCGERPERVVDAVLRSHHAEVGREEALAALQAGIGRRRGTNRAMSGALRTTRHVARRHPAARRSRSRR